MKKIIFILFMIIPLSVFSQEHKEKFLIDVVGLGVVSSDSAYKGMDDHSSIIPIVSIKYKRFFIQGPKMGYAFFENDYVAVDIVSSIRFSGYDADDSSFFNGMQDRKRSLDIGMQFDSTIFDENTFFSAAFLTDMLSVHKGHEAVFTLSRPYKHDYFVLTPKIGFRWQSEGLVDYYYGVKKAEATGLRPEYLPNSDSNFFAQIDLKFGISKDVIFLVFFDVQQLGDSIKKSPLIDDKYSFTTVLGVAKRF